MFIKDEPLTDDKIRDGRYRLIHCLAIEDQLVDRCLFHPWVGVEVRNVGSVVSKAGWSPLPGGYKALSTVFPDGGSVAVDKSAWDWTMPPWVVEAYLQVKKLQCHGWDDRYERAVRTRLAQVVGPLATIRLCNGLEFKQEGWGIMKSGWLLTLSMNSMAQLNQHALACFRMGENDPPLMWAMGDDSLIRMKHDAQVLDQYEKALATTGCLVKKSVLKREFCGVRIEGDLEVSVTPLYIDKHKFVLSYVEPRYEQDTLQSYMLLYSLSADRWVDEYKDRLDLNYGPLYPLWAKGLIKLQVLDNIPPWASW
nr:RNA-dependent RNA polymerase [Solemoviridae sp.]